MSIKLYQFCISHYSEKVRWALDYKGINYQPVNLLPGQHRKTILSLTRDESSVPVLDDDGEIVQGSSRILDYLDETFPDNPLTPADSQQKAQALAWEKRLDEEAGPAIRTWIYHYFLQRPKVVVPMLTAGTPFYNRILLSLAFSRVDEIMREAMKINQKTADQAQETLESLLTELAEVYRKQPFLAGEHVTRADITAGALLAPLFMPPQHPVPWPKPHKVPRPVQAWLKDWQATVEPVARMYRENR